MIGVEDWAEIRRRHSADGRSIKSIARELGLARNTVRMAIRAQAPPHYARHGSRRCPALARTPLPGSREPRLHV